MMTVQRLTRNERRDIVNSKMLNDLIIRGEIPVSEASGISAALAGLSIQDLDYFYRAYSVLIYPISGDLIARLV